MRTMLRILILAFTAGCATMALADPLMPDGIVAVVNDQVISSVDVEDRLILVMRTTGIADSPETRARLLPQILHQLVDEKLQMQDAAANSIVVSDEKLHEGIAQLEKQNGKVPGSLEQFLAAKGVSKSSFYAQMRAQIAWSEIIGRKVRPKIRISDQEIARYVKRKETAPTAGHPGEVMIAVMQLPVDSPTAEANVKKLADKLASEIHSGASFEAIAGQFSSGTGTTKVTDPFWVDASQLDPQVTAALGKIHNGEVTEPVRTAAGYQIVKLMGARAAQAPEPAAPADVARAELAYKQILMTLKPDAEKKEAELLLQLAKQVAASPGECNAKTMSGVGDLAAMDFKVTLERGISSDLSDKLRELLMGLHVGGVSEPVVTPQGIRVFMLCERIDLPAAPASTAATDNVSRQAIYQEKLELEAQKYLRNLRRDAFIEVRH